MRLVLVILFTVGLILVFSLDRTIFKPRPAAAGLGFGIPLSVAFAVGFHGFGEGEAFSATAATTSSINLLDAFVEVQNYHPDMAVDHACWKSD